MYRVTCTICSTRFLHYNYVSDRNNTSSYWNILPESFFLRYNWYDDEDGDYERIATNAYIFSFLFVKSLLKPSNLGFEEMTYDSLKPDILA